VRRPSWPGAKWAHFHLQLHFRAAHFAPGAPFLRLLLVRPDVHLGRNTWPSPDDKWPPDDNYNSLGAPSRARPQPHLCGGWPARRGRPLAASPSGWEAGRWRCSFEWPPRGTPIGTYIAHSLRCTHCMLYTFGAALALGAHLTGRVCEQTDGRLSLAPADCRPSVTGLRPWRMDRGGWIVAADKHWRPS